MAEPDGTGREPVLPESSMGQRRSHLQSNLARSRLSPRIADAEAEAQGVEGLPSHAAGEGQRAGDPRSAGLSVGVGLVRTRGLLLRTEGPHAPRDLCLLRDARFSRGERPFAEKARWGPTPGVGSPGPGPRRPNPLQGLRGTSAGSEKHFESERMVSERKRERGPDAPRGGRTSGTRCRVNRASPGRSQSADRECPEQASLRYRQCRIRGRGGGGRGFRGAATAFWNWKGWPRPSLVNVLSAAEVCTSERFKWQLLVLCSAAPQEVAGAGPSRRLPAEVPRKVFSALPHARTFA